MCVAIATSVRLLNRQSRSLTRPANAIEPFESAPASKTLAFTLGKSADLLIANAASVSDTETALILGDARFVIKEFEAIDTLSIKHASQTAIVAVNADIVVARGLMVTQYFCMHATAAGLRRNTNPHSRTVHVYRADGGSDQTFGIAHTTRDTHMDLTHLAAGRRPPMAFKGVRIDGDMRAHLHGPTGAFATPELLKRHALAGVTLVMGAHESECSVAFRRFRARDGYIAFRAELDRQQGTVTVRHATYADGAPPRQPLNAMRGLEWTDDGEYEVPSFHATVAEPSGIGKAEALSADELRRSMTNATSVTIPLEARPYRLVVAEATPGRVRVSALGVDGTVCARMIHIENLMSGDSKRFSSSTTAPLQILVDSGSAVAAPVGDHLHFAHAVEAAASGGGGAMAD
jgi:hypothetical protein